MLALLALFACLEPGANNVAPEVRITSPDNESEFRDGEPITVRADLEDDDGPNSLTIFWDVSPEPDTPGNPLTGNDDASLYFQDGLEIGEYDIKVTAVDVYNLQAEDTIHLNIDENNPPSVRIDNPIEDAVYDLGDPIVVEVLVKPKDDEMGQIELEWGGIAEGNEEAPSRPPDTGLVIFYVQGVEKGRQELSVKAFDSSGAADTETVSFRVR